MPLDMPNLERRQEINEKLNPSEVANAAGEVSALVQHMAQETATEVGFGWIAKADAPDSLNRLEVEYEVSQKTGEPLPVSSLFCDTTIYTNKAVNHAVRFWHDVSHIRTRFTFELPDEIELGHYHLKQAEDAEVNRHSTAWELLRIDFVGQAYLLGVTGHFPIDQGRFVKDALIDGMDAAIVKEAARQKEIPHH